MLLSKLRLKEVDLKNRLLQKFKQEKKLSVELMPKIISVLSQPKNLLPKKEQGLKQKLLLKKKLLKKQMKRQELRLKWLLKELKSKQKNEGLG